jgi:hypothetical protein
MLKRLPLAALVTALLAASGCLQKEKTQTLYLDPDGSVAWVASEIDVRSDEADLGKRSEEEQAYIGEALLGTHRVARAFDALGPSTAVQTTVLRDRRPFHVVTEARFGAIDRVLERLFTGMGVRARASLVRDGGSVTLRVRLDFGKPIKQDETPLSELFDDIDHFRFVLTDARFGEVSGFDVTDGVSATLSSDWMERAEKAYERRGAIELSLSWSE